MSKTNKDYQLIEIEEMIDIAWGAKDKANEIYAQYYDKKILLDPAIIELNKLQFKAKEAKRNIVSGVIDSSSSGLSTALLMYYLEIRDAVKEIDEVIHDVYRLSLERGDWK